MNKYLILFLKGMGVGAANIIPGVSGGTIALITELFEDLINSLKSFNIVAFKLLLSGKFKEFIEYTNFLFLLTVLGGAIIGIYLLAFILEPLLIYCPNYIMAFFFGLILASVIFVGKTVNNWSLKIVLFFLTGVIVAISITFIFDIASENNSYWYVFVCGMVAICSMLLPGLSGSFVLLLMGNYELIMIRSVKNMDIQVLIPLFAGAILGLIAFSHLLSWVFKKFKNQTIATLTGFIFGSLGFLWPWKTELKQSLENGKEIVIGYDWFIPKNINQELLIIITLIILGFISIFLIEKFATLNNDNKSSVHNKH